MTPGTTAATAQADSLLDVVSAPLEGTSAIEASAGTGKTFTITQLYLRLVVEKDLPIERILVVTYTVAATEELRGRIRGVLGAARERIAAGDLDDDLLRALAERVGPAAAVERLQSALRSFDEAAIFTIHGFCQRVLADKAFESAMPFETELLADESDLLREIVEDFWRQRFYDASRLLAGFLVARGWSPGDLLATVRGLVAKPYLTATPLDDPPYPAARLEASYAAAFAAARRVWLAARGEIESLLLSDDRLSRSHYPAASIPAWAAELDALLRNEEPRLEMPEHFDKFTAGRIAADTKKGKTPPSHAFFEGCGTLGAARESLVAAYDALLRRVRVELVDFARRELAERKRRQRVQSYDDLLLNLSLALDRDATGRLAAGIRERYLAALIDEFQDTDPVQHRIFRKVYAGSGLPVFLVGDPKQAIYSFRGADIFTYLAAREHADRVYRLDRNWRSDPGLIEAVNALFRGPGGRAFLFDAIPFRAARAAEKERQRLCVAGDPPEPFWLWILRRPAPGDGAPGRLAEAEPPESRPEATAPPRAARRESEREQEPLGKARARELAARATAAEIARLLHLATKGEATIGGAALGGGNIAVLVHTNREARLIRRRLLELRVPSVQLGSESVFATREALELERVLLAVATPGDESRFKAALATEMLGVGGEEIHLMQEPGNESAWESRANRIRGYHERWRNQGFVRMFRELATAEGIPGRLLAFADGERRLTNLLHLGELLAAAEGRQRLGIESLLRWMSDRRRTAAAERDERVEEQQLRLESDENLVKIVTVHKSKGLQYDIVFCPFLWDGRLWSTDPRAMGEPFLFHDPRTFEPMVDFGSGREAELRQHARNEEIAEKLRLLYVAVTRAKHRCVAFWGAISEAGTSAPAWLLHQPFENDSAPDPDLVRRNFEALPDDDALLAALEPLVERSRGTLRVDAAPEAAGVAWEPAADTAPALRARRLSRPVPEGFRVASFSALAAGHEARAGMVEVDLPDHDARPFAPAIAPEPAPERTIFSFPRGVRAGRCLHAVFETLDFSRLDGSEAGLDAVRRIVARQLAEHRFDAEWLGVLGETVARALTLPLDRAGALRLAGLPAARCAKELEFYYPVAGLDADRLRRALLEHAVADGRFAADVARLSFGAIRGFMRGFVDLVFEADGRFYVVDYKSNHLGDRPEDYTPDRIEAAMGREAYFLQYLIYTLSLHRLLRLRLADYDPPRHLGGVFYTFIRGLDPSREPGWSVFHDRPSPELIEALDGIVGAARGGR